MKYFMVTFVPNGRQDKEWMVWEASSKDELKKFFNGGSLIDIEEISEERYYELLINIGDKVQFLQPNFIVYDKEGSEVYEKLKPGNIYTVKWKGILSISLEELEGVYLTEHFRKVKQ